MDDPLPRLLLSAFTWTGCSPAWCAGDKDELIGTYPESRLCNFKVGMNAEMMITYPVSCIQKSTWQCRYVRTKLLTDSGTGFSPKTFKEVSRESGGPRGVSRHGAERGSLSANKASSTFFSQPSRRDLLVPPNDQLPSGADTTSLFVKSGYTWSPRGENQHVF
ncbi:hypothetical protein DFH06DRAFT_1138730 [Mycena polygramma]|nr:hypothetical protein DFH06DRAFT_1138730 [Mycena polygramma]